MFLYNSLNAVNSMSSFLEVCGGYMLMNVKNNYSWWIVMAVIFLYVFLWICKSILNHSSNTYDVLWNFSLYVVLNL